MVIVRDRETADTRGNIGAGHGEDFLPPLE